MNVVELIIYNCFSQLILPEDTEKLQEKLYNYSQPFQYSVGIVTQQNLIVLKENGKDKLNYSQAKDFLQQIDSILYKQFYNNEEQDIIVGFHLAKSFSSLLPVSPEMVELFESLSKKSSLKTEIIYCIEEIKYSLLTYYVLNGIKQDEVEQLIIELEAIEDRHNSINIFGYKENGSNQN